MTFQENNNRVNFYSQLIISILITIIGILISSPLFKIPFGKALYIIGFTWIIIISYLKYKNNKSDNKLITIKEVWNWIWNSDSILSWLVALVLIFVFIKFIFFPGLSLILGTQLPLAGVESSSMDHSSLKYCTKYNSNGQCLQLSQNYEICGSSYNRKMNFNLDEYWNTCGKWYEEYDISKEEFSKFSLKNGFSKGDIIIVWGRFEPKIGDIIIFKPNEGSYAPRPIIHRIVKIKDRTIETKGDHNELQLKSDNNPYKTDETTIIGDKIVGKAVFKIPYLGYVKIWAVELWNKFF